MISLGQPFRLWGLSRALGLGLGSTASLLGAYYFGRRQFLRRLFPEVVVLDLPEWGKVPVRTNGYDHGLLKQIFLRQDYQLKAQDVHRILDLGANIGMASVYLHRLFPEAEFACIEPSPQNTPLLKQALALNGIRGRVFEAAVGDEEGTVDLHLSAAPDCTSIYPGQDVLDVVRVPQVSVPHVLREMGWDSLDVVKIDIEGAEKMVFTQNNSWLHNVRIIVGEGHVGVGYPYAQLARDLNGFGFKLTTLIEEAADHGASFRAEKLRVTTEA
jgi:FkbM family methyltransferase